MAVRCDNWDPAQVGSDGEVRHGTDKERDGEQVVKDLLAIGRLETEDVDDEETEGVETADTPDPIVAIVSHGKVQTG